MNSYAPQTTPGDAVRKIRTKGLIIEIRGSDGHVHCAPSDVRQAAVPHIARTEVLEVAVDARGAFVLTSAISNASKDVVGAEAHTTQLLSRILLTSVPFLPGQCMMSASIEVQEMGGSMLDSHEATGGMNPR